MFYEVTIYYNTEVENEVEADVFNIDEHQLMSFIKKNITIIGLSICQLK